MSGALTPQQRRLVMTHIFKKGIENVKQLVFLLDVIRSDFDAEELYSKEAERFHRAYEDEIEEETRLWGVDLRDYIGYLASVIQLKVLVAPRTTEGLLTNFCGGKEAKKIMEESWRWIGKWYRKGQSEDDPSEWSYPYLTEDVKALERKKEILEEIGEKGIPEPSDVSAHDLITVLPMEDFMSIIESWEKARKKAQRRR